MRTLFATCSMIMIGIMGMAQITKPIGNKPASTMTLESPVISSPVSGSTINGTFVIVGTAKPNATVTLQVSPIYKTGTGKTTLVPINKAYQYKAQSFTVTADANGKFQSPMVDVKFYDNAIERRIHIFSAQKSGMLSSKGKVIEYKVPQTLTVITAPIKIKQQLKITSHSDGQDAYGAIQILGTGEPGLKITVSLYAFAEVTPKKDRSAWSLFKAAVLPNYTYSTLKNELSSKGTQVKEKYFNSYEVTIDQNGKWYIPQFMSFGSPDWMRNAFIPFAWLISAQSTDPNYREGNTTKIRLGCK